MFLYDFSHPAFKMRSAANPTRLGVVAAAAVGSLAEKAQSANLFAPGDRAVAIDRDAGSSGTAPAPAPAGQQYPNTEGPTNLIDYDPNDPTFAAILTKYLNFGKEGGGVIVTASNPAVAKKIGFVTANDATERDPLTFRLYGTNSPIVSANNSGGTAEPWTLIYSGNTNIGTSGPNFPYYADISSNTASYKSYKLLLTSLRNGATANSMQLAEMQLYTDLNGDFQDPGGTDRILAQGNPIISIDGYQSNHPSAEIAPNVVDGTTAKYLNFGKQNSGFVVTPSRGSSVAHSFRITTANDSIGLVSPFWP